MCEILIRVIILHQKRKKGRKRKEGKREGKRREGKGGEKGKGKREKRKKLRYIATRLKCCGLALWEFYKFRFSKSNLTYHIFFNIWLEMMCSIRY